MQTIIVNIINNRKFDQLLRTAALWVAPSLACGFVARRSQPHCGGCSLLAPRHRPNWAQQNTSHLGDTTLAGGTNIRATLAGLAPLHAARASQRNVPTTRNT